MKLFGSRSRPPSEKATLSLAVDAFSDGQIGSKIWLCHELESAIHAEPRLSDKPLVIWVLAGWHGLLPFLLFSRERLRLAQIVLFDREPAAVATSLQINDRWRFKNQFSAHVRDVNEPFADSALPLPDVVINTSCEHFSEQGWWQQIRAGAMVVLQSTDMPHSEHVSQTSSAAELRDKFPSWRQIRFSGEMRFDYGSFAFTRHMVIGIKGGPTSEHARS